MAGSHGHFLRTELGRPMLCLRGYMYTKHCTIATAFKALWRMICKIRLRTIYRSNPEVRTLCGIIAALALLPENDVHLGLENLKDMADEIPLRTIPLIEYAERVCVGSEGSPARFSPPRKNCP